MTGALELLLLLKKFSFISFNKNDLRNSNSDAVDQHLQTSKLQFYNCIHPVVVMEDIKRFQPVQDYFQILTKSDCCLHWLPNNYCFIEVFDFHSGTMYIITSNIPVS